MNFVAKLTVFVACLCSVSATNATRTLHIRFLLNSPYLYRENNTFAGELPYILNYTISGPCKHLNLKVKYSRQYARYNDLLATIENASKLMSGDKIYAIAPVVDVASIAHNYRKFIHILTIVESHGYTLITNMIVKNKIYRIVVFGFGDSLSLIVTLVLFISIAAMSVWLVERRKNSRSAFSYRLLPGVWDGIWWASVTATTVGYGDKTPKSFLGRLIGLIWLFVSCALLSAFTAILTGSVTEETSSISGRKIAYVNGSMAKHYINERTGIPVAAATYEDAIKLALSRDVYGSMLDTNYVTFEQDRLYKRGIVVDGRFHEQKINTVFVIVKSNLDKNQTIYNCLSKEFTKHADIHHMRPKGNPYRSAAEKLSLSNDSVSVAFACLYGTLSVFVLIGVGIEAVIIFRSFNKKQKANGEPPAIPKPEELLPKLRESIVTMDKEFLSIKQMIAQIEESQELANIRMRSYGITNKAMKTAIAEDRL